MMMQKATATWHYTPIRSLVVLHAASTIAKLTWRSRNSFPHLRLRVRCYYYPGESQVSAMDSTLGPKKKANRNRCVRSATTSHCEDCRASIISLSAQGETLEAIVTWTGFSCSKITNWQQQVRLLQIDRVINKPTHRRNSTLPTNTFSRVPYQIRNRLLASRPVALGAWHKAGLPSISSGIGRH